jgi:predicted RNA-binding Zn-ribbon protein involved in translation (DUF1610 family)
MKGKPRHGPEAGAIPYTVVASAAQRWGEETAVRKANRESRKPSELRIRKDEKCGKRMLTGALLFGAAMLGVLAAGLWTILSSGGQGGDASRAQSLAVIIAILCVFASVVNCFVAYGKLRWFYRCPSCGKRLTRPCRELGPIQYPCDSCGVLWDTGWEADLD